MTYIYYLIEFSCRYKHHSHFTEWKRKFGEIKEYDIPISLIVRRGDSLSDLKGVACEGRTLSHFKWGGRSAK